MIITGIDIGFSKFGICVINYTGGIVKKIKSNIELLDTIEFSGNEKKKERYIKFIQDKIIQGDLIKRVLVNSDIVIIEKPFNIKGWGQVLLELLGIIKYLCIEAKVEFVEIPQMTLKKFATGIGKAQKSEMVLHAYKEFKVQGNSEDAIDAFWCAMVGVALRYKQVFKKGRMDVINKIIQGNHRHPGEK